MNPFKKKKPPVTAKNFTPDMSRLSIEKIQATAIAMVTAAVMAGQEADAEDKVKTLALGFSSAFSDNMSVEDLAALPSLLSQFCAALVMVIASLNDQEDETLLVWSQLADTFRQATTTIADGNNPDTWFDGSGTD